MGTVAIMPIDLSKTGLADKYEAAGTSLTKRHLTAERAAVYLVADYSGSMRGFYRDGSVQHLAEQALALSAWFDDDGVVPVILFDGAARKPVDVSVHNYAGVIDHIVSRAGTMGSTNYAAAMQAVVDLHAGNPTPAFVIFQTDGAPDSESAAEAVIRGSSRLPIFWQFVGFGDDKFTFLRKLDKLRGRAVDNAGFYPAGPHPRSVPNQVVFDGLLAEYPAWRAAYARLAAAGR